MDFEGTDMRLSAKPVVERIRGQQEPPSRVRFRFLVHVGRSII